MATMIYTLNDIEKIAWGDNNIVLPTDTIDLINSLSEQVGAPTYIKTPSFSINNNNNNNYSKNNNKKKKKTDIISNEDWDTIRNFQKTEITKKDGIEKEIDNIRLSINKLTERTFDKIIENIHIQLNDINDNDNYDSNSMNKIGYAIFNMATSNKFNSKVYAKLCCELKEKYEFMTDIIENNISQFMELFENMIFVSPDENYDKFCEMNIINEKRRSMSLFLTNLYTYKVITIDIIMNNITNIQNMIIDKDSILNSDKIQEIEELSENLFILLSNMNFDELKSNSEWSNIYNNIMFIKNVDINIFLGISHKAKFKHMDILDKIN
jgi:hypothetical protein